ncbi:hypothetical protein [Ochrobactrum sp. SFR4]|uniref:hypothetical protein n=1 Tax=Ochrobactrum sp. SFR4 TaxID=2717368 RepID=UPI001C8B4A4F|nr:hypothetical protein [Ochrobactrum sp. SFR4]MBX8825260.1 hypothetical protein [Ochrobactrum sp. SFR4]
MFTIKHIHRHGETLFSGKEPQYHSTMCSSEGMSVSYENEHGVRIYITGGTVYVMNDAGRTVANYELGGNDRPVDEGSLIGGGSLSGV